MAAAFDLPQAIRYSFGMPKLPTQEDVRDDLAARWLERLMLRNRAAHAVIHRVGRWGLTCMIYPRFVAPFACRMKVLPLPLPGLEPGLEAYRVLFISDLHVGKTNQTYLESTLRKAVDGLEPDVILIGGDLIDYQPDALPLLARILPVLQAPGGVYSIFGNHDYREYSWRHVGARSARRTIHRRLCGLLEDRAIHALVNSHVTLRRNNAAVQIVGLDEMWTGLADPDLAFEGVDPALPTICLNHNPDGYDGLREYPWHWLLCGHSHGGQVDIPGLGALYVPQKHKERLRGLFTFPDPKRGPNAWQRMYISTGVGYSHPLRLRVPPEVTLFTLTSDAEPPPSLE